jgi:hypothetical protein
VLASTAISTYVTKSLTIVPDKSTIENACQTIRIRKLAVFDNGNGFPSEAVDVSNTAYDVDLETSNASILQIVDKYYLAGLSEGTAAVAAKPLFNSAGITYLTASVTVISASSSDTISIISMQGVDWSLGSTQPVILDKNPLTAEGDTHMLLPIFTNTGVILTTPQNNGMIQSIVSNNTAVYTVSPASNSAYRFWNGLIPPGQSPFSSIKN